MTMIQTFDFYDSIKLNDDSVVYIPSKQARQVFRSDPSLNDAEMMDIGAPCCCCSSIFITFLIALPSQELTLLLFKEEEEEG